MTFCASILVANLDSANATLEAQGFGPNNFSVPTRTSGASGDATHASLSHGGVDAAFRAAIAAIPGVMINNTAFTAHITSRALAWPDPEKWYQNPIMTGATRTYDGKQWVSLMDYNVWAPPIGWREVVATGNPAWVQPVGAVDAYPLGAKVLFNGKNYESTIAANVWSPIVYPAGWKAI